MNRSNSYKITIILLLLVSTINSTKEKKQKKKSQYTNVFYSKTKKLNPWRVIMNIEGKKKYFGCFDTEERAGKQVNAICKKYDISEKNPSLSSDDEQEKRRIQKISQYTYVFYNKTNKSNPWEVRMKIEGKSKYFGCFDTEEKAGKQVNAICKKYDISKENPSLSSDDEQDQRRNQKKSQYSGVSYNKCNKSNPWRVKLKINGKETHFGYFDTERKAAEEVNTLRATFGKSKKNTNLSSDDEFQEQKEKPAQKIDDEQIYIQKVNQKEIKSKDLKRKRENNKKEPFLMDLSGSEKAQDLDAMIKEEFQVDLSEYEKVGDSYSIKQEKEEEIKLEEDLDFGPMIQNVLNESQEQFFRGDLLAKSSINLRFSKL